MLFILKNRIKKTDPELWRIYRDESRGFESEIMTAYKVVMGKGSCRHGKLHYSSYRLAMAVRCNLYFTLALFMIVLSVGLYASVNK
jgi:hypothetical protein